MAQPINDKINQALAADMNDKVAFKSGATSSEVATPFQFVPINGLTRTAKRFQYGNVKHEAGQTVYADANWVKALEARDWAFFRDRFNHMLTHGWNELRGLRDGAPGGNIGAVGWMVHVAAYIEDVDPTFYEVIIGLRHPSQMADKVTLPANMQHTPISKSAGEPQPPEQECGQLDPRQFHEDLVKRAQRLPNLPNFGPCFDLGCGTKATYISVTGNKFCWFHAPGGSTHIDTFIENTKCRDAKS